MRQKCPKGRNVGAKMVPRSEMSGQKCPTGRNVGAKIFQEAKCRSQHVPKGEMSGQKMSRKAKCSGWSNVQVAKSLCLLFANNRLLLWISFSWRQLFGLSLLDLLLDFLLDFLLDLLLDLLWPLGQLTRSYDSFGLLVYLPTLCF